MLQFNLITWCCFLSSWYKYIGIATYTGLSNVRSGNAFWKSECLYAVQAKQQLQVWIASPKHIVRENIFGHHFWSLSDHLWLILPCASASSMFHFFSALIWVYSEDWFLFWTLYFITMLHLLEYFSIPAALPNISLYCRLQSNHHWRWANLHHALYLVRLFLVERVVL